MKVVIGNCAGCGREGITSWRKKRGERDPKGFMLAKIEHNIYCCNIKCYNQYREKGGK